MMRMTTATMTSMMPPRMPIASEKPIHLVISIASITSDLASSTEKCTSFATPTSTKLESSMKLSSRLPP